MAHQQHDGIRIVAINGSVRAGNFTSMALALVEDELRGQPNVQVDVVHPDKLDLPFPGEDRESADVDAMQELVAAATGVVLATPEYHGSYSSVIKLVIDNLGFPSSLSGKPVTLLGVAGGQIGAIKALEHLRSVCSHVGAIALPGSVSVAQVRDVFDEAGICLDEHVERRIRSVGTNLLEYISQNICPRMAQEAMERDVA